MCTTQFAMRSSSCCCICFPAFGRAAVNHTTTLFVNHGESAKIRCNYSRTDDTEIMTVDLKTLNHTHMCSYIHLTSWQKQSCKDHIRFRWISEAEEISFELLNLRIKDTGTYTCTVRRTAKPPQVDLGVQRVLVIGKSFIYNQNCFYIIIIIILYESVHCSQCIPSCLCPVWGGLMNLPWFCALWNFITILLNSCGSETETSSKAHSQTNHSMDSLVSNHTL